MPDRPYFDRVVAASGLSPVIAPFTISRLLVRADVLPDDLTPADLARALPVLEEGLSVYLRGDELERARRDVRALAEQDA
jgi:hypothetical protein